MVICNCRVYSIYGMWSVGYALYVICMVYNVIVNVMCDLGVSNFGWDKCGILIMINPMCVCIVCVCVYVLCVCVCEMLCGL